MTTFTREVGAARTGIAAMNLGSPRLLGVQQMMLLGQLWNMKNGSPVSGRKRNALVLTSVSFAHHGKYSFKSPQTPGYTRRLGVVDWLASRSVTSKTVAAVKLHTERHSVF